MVRYNFDAIIDRSNSTSDKWEGMAKFDSRATADTLPFWVADMDFACAEGILAALHQRVDQRIFGYGSAPDELYRDIIAWYQRRFNWQLKADELCFAPGIVAAVGYLIDLLTEPGAGVIIQPPVYYPFAATISGHGRKIINNPLIDDGSGYYTIDFDDFAAKAAEHKLFIFCSPHNPVGRVWTREEVARLLKICRDNGVTVIADEIHHDLLRRGQQQAIIETVLPEYRDKIITCIAPSKTFNLAGLQFSQIVIHDAELREQWQHHVRGICGIYGPNVLTIKAAQAAYATGEDWLEQVLDYLDGNMAMMREFLAERLPRAIFLPPQGTYLTWVNLKAYGFDDELYGRFIREGKVLVEDGIVFGEEGRGYVRINAACPRELLREGLARIADVIEKQ